MEKTRTERIGLMNKLTKLIIGIGLLVLVGYNSVYFKPLDEVKKASTEKEFSPTDFAKDLMQNQIGKVEAIDVLTFFPQLTSSFDSFNKEYGRELGVSNYRYFMLKGEGRVTNIGEENVSLSLSGLDDQNILLATDFIFGNTLRDASGLVSISDYANTMDFNNISVEMNRIVKEEIVPPFALNVAEGEIVTFKGAIRLNVVEKKWENLRVIPISLIINPKTED